MPPGRRVEHLTKLVHIDKQDTMMHSALQTCWD